jgi:hypothetical protein
MFVMIRGQQIVYFNIYESVRRKNILTHPDATLHSLIYLGTAQHVSGGNTTHHQECKQLYLQHLLFVTPLLPPAALAAGSSNSVTNTRYYRSSFCSPDDGWRYHPKHIEQFPDKINCVTLHLVGYIFEYRILEYCKLS